MLALTLLLSAMAGMLVSCKGDDEECTEHIDNDGDKKCDYCEADMPDGGPSDPSEKPSEKTSYTVSVKTAGGMPIEGATVVVYADNTLDDLEGYASTDASGIAKLSLYPSSTYAIEISGVPAGYEKADYYSFSGTSASITLTSKVLPDTGLSGVKYKLGDIMRDFTITNVNGKKLTLSELLAEKELVMLNFWYIDCSACVMEFPCLVESYEKYKDDVAVIAINPNTSDNVTDIKLFINQYGLTFDVAQDAGVGLANAFGVTNYPTSVFIDRYGVITFVEVGALTETKYFDKLFQHYTAEPYNQKLVTSYEDVAPVEKPNISMPSSDEIADVISPDAGIVYSPEIGTTDAEFAWPFIIAEKDGVACVKSSNAEKDSSYSIMHAEVSLTAGQALKLEYFISSELGADLLYILVDGVSISTISGVGTGWQTCYPYVATEDGTYDVTFLYLKDSTTDTEDDCVYIKSLSIGSDSSVITTPTYIPRWAATVPNSNGLGYQKYVEIVLGADGYYHVGSATGPLLLANLMGVTPFSSQDSVYSIIYNSAYTGGDLAKYYDAIVKYCNYASNAQINGLCTVDTVLADYLDKVATSAGFEKDNPKQWLQFCLYYDAYGTNGVQLEDPIAGLAPHSAYKAVANENVGLEVYPNVYTYDRAIMPKGLWFQFTPTVAGAYRIVSNVDKNSTAIEDSLQGWIFREDGSLFYQYVISERIIDDPNNVYMYVYLEQDQTYYIDIAYYDIYTVGSFGFKIEYLGESYEHFRAVSPGAPFTYEIGKGLALFDMTGDPIEGGEDFFASITTNEGVITKAFYDDVIYSITRTSNDGTEFGGEYTGKDANGNAYLGFVINPTDKTITFTCTNPLISKGDFANVTVRYEVVEGEVTETIIPGGVKVVYDADEDCYYNVLPDGTKGASKIYADFSLYTGIFSNKHIAGMIEVGAFNFALTETDKNGLILLDQYTMDELRNLWGEDFDENYALYQLDDLQNGIYHGKGTDMTDVARKYLAQMIAGEENPLELRGCVVVNKELADLLQLLMDKYTFEGVENSWVKLCYYYETIGEGWQYISELR